MYLLLCVESLGRIALGVWKPIVTLETPPGRYANYGLSAVGVLMLWLSLRVESREPPGDERAAHHGRPTSR